MHLSKNTLLICFTVSLLLTIGSAFFYVVAYMEVGGMPQERVNGCSTRAIVSENDRYITICPEDSLKGKVSAFIAPKAAVASILFLTLFFYKSSQEAKNYVRKE